jgi:hypothetical protein
MDQDVLIAIGLLAALGVGLYLLYRDKTRTTSLAISPEAIQEVPPEVPSEELGRLVTERYYPIPQGWVSVQSPYIEVEPIE